MPGFVLILISGLRSNLVAWIRDHLLPGLRPNLDAWLRVPTLLPGFVCLPCCRASCAYLVAGLRVPTLLPGFIPTLLPGLASFRILQVPSRQLQCEQRLPVHLDSHSAGAL
jgi:hypothetical protein